jgi:hypothetical protein
MSHSNVEFDGREFVQRDACIEGWMALVTAAIRRRGAPEPWLAALVALWAPTIEHGGYGCIHAGLLEHVTSQERREILVALAEDVHSRFGYGETTDARALGVTAAEPEWLRQPLPASYHRDASAFFVALLRGDLLIDFLVARPDPPAPRFAPLRSAEPGGAPETWDRASRSNDWRERRAVAESARALARLLADLSCDAETLVRLAVARSPVARADVLDLLARDESYLSRQAVAAHPAASPATLAWLTADAHPSIRR